MFGFGGRKGGRGGKYSQEDFERLAAAYLRKHGGKIKQVRSSTPAIDKQVAKWIRDTAEVNGWNDKTQAALARTLRGKIALWQDERQKRRRK